MSLLTLQEYKGEGELAIGYTQLTLVNTGTGRFESQPI
jgi:hypothetical protein